MNQGREAIVPDREGDAWQDKENKRTEGFAEELRKSRQKQTENDPDKAKRERIARNSQEALERLKKMKPVKPAEEEPEQPNMFH